MILKESSPLGWYSPIPGHRTYKLEIPLSKEWWFTPHGDARLLYLSAVTQCRSCTAMTQPRKRSLVSSQKGECKKSEWITELSTIVLSWFSQGVELLWESPKVLAKVAIWGLTSDQLRFSWEWDPTVWIFSLVLKCFKGSQKQSFYQLFHQKFFRCAYLGVWNYQTEQELAIHVLIPAELSSHASLWPFLKVSLLGFEVGVIVLPGTTTWLFLNRQP